jgi:hypothetical protein
MKSRLTSCAAALTLLAAAAPAAAQYVNPDTCSMADFSCQQANQEKSKRSAADYEEQAKHRAQREKAEQERRRALLKAPPLPAERNGLLGSWRLDAGERSNVVEPGQGSSRERVARELINAFSIAGLKEIGCAASYRGDMSFTSSTYTYSVRGSAGSAGGPIAYRAALIDGKPAIAAIPGDSRQVMMVFANSSPDRIVGEDGCTLVRVGSPAANAAANGANAPGNARTGVASSSAPPAAGGLPQVASVAPAPPPTPSRPPPEVCRNTLLDQLGTVGVAQVRAMAKVRFTEAAIEGKVPNSDNLRLDLRGSACGEDPRVKASLYDFDANGMLQSITYVWDRPAGPAPAPIFQERVTQLSRFHSLPAPQTPGRLQADTSLGRLILQDIPERNLLLEAYAAKK